MIIGIKKVSQGAGSAVIIKDDSRCEIMISSPRLTRTATLDLGTVIDNQGYAVGDRTLRISSKISESDESKLWDLYKNNLYLLVSTRDGMFFGAVDEINLDRGQLEMTFLIKE